MSSYTIWISLHVLVAVLGVGQLGAVAIIASSARRAGTTIAHASTWLGPLLRTTRISLAAAVVTGGLTNFSAGGAFQHQRWFHVSVLLLILTFVLHRRASAALRRAEVDALAALRRVERTGWSMCGIMAVITVLMEAKPF
jgi:uncharacterized membrane protein